MVRSTDPRLRPRTVREYGYMLAALYCIRYDATGASKLNAPVCVPATAATVIVATIGDESSMSAPGLPTRHAMDVPELHDTVVQLVYPS